MKTQKTSKLKLSLPFFKSFNFDKAKIKIPKSSININDIKLFKENNLLNRYKLPSINFNINSDNSTNQNSFKNYGKFPISLQKNKFGDSLEKLFFNRQKKLRNLFKNFFDEKDKNNNTLQLSRSNSTIILLKNLKKYRIRNDLNFHKNLMSFNKDKLNKSYQESKKTIIEEDNYIQNIGKEPEKKKKMGIFGSRNNIINIIRAEMERLKYDNIYKGVDADLKEMIIDEIMDAQLKLKRKPENLVFNKKLERPLYLKKIDKYKYISSMNRIRVLNQIANVSVVEEDGNIMKRLSNDAYDALIHKRGKNQ